MSISFCRPPPEPVCKTPSGAAVVPRPDPACAIIPESRNMGAQEELDVVQVIVTVSPYSIVFVAVFSGFAANAARPG